MAKRLLFSLALLGGLATGCVDNHFVRDISRTLGWRHHWQAVPKDVPYTAHPFRSAAPFNLDPQPVPIDLTKNIGHLVLDVERNAEWYDVPDRCNHLLDDILEAAQDIDTTQKPEDVILSLQRMFTEDFNFAISYEPVNRLSDVMKKERHVRKKVDCDIYSIIYLAAAEVLGLPLTGIALPDHFALRWGDAFYLDMPLVMKVDETYLRENYEVPEKGIFLKSLTKQQVLSGAYFNAGWELEQSNLIEKALQQYTQATSLNPQFPEAFIKKAELHLAFGQYEEALSSANAALALQHDPHAEKYKMLAMAGLDKPQIVVGPTQKEVLYTIADK